MNISKRERTLITIVLILAVIAAYYVFFLKPYIDDFGELSSQRTTKSVDLETKTMQQAQVDKLDEQIAGLTEEIESTIANIPQGFDQPPMLVYLEETVNTHAQKIAFTFKHPEMDGQMTITPVTISMYSSYDGLKAILQEFSSGKYVIRVTGMRAGIVVDSFDRPEVPAVQDDDTAEPAQDESPQPERQDDDETPNDGTVSDDGTTAENGAETTAEETEDTAIPEADDESASINTEEDFSDPYSTDIVDPLEITLDIEILSIGSDIPPGMSYPFDDMPQSYGGDIFY